MQYTVWVQVDEYIGVYLTEEEAAAFNNGGVWLDVEGDFGIYLVKQ